MFFRRRSHETRGSRDRDRNRMRRRPSLEALEGRVVLSTFTVTSLADANPPAGALTLRQAIQDANADHNTNPATPDIINFAVSGTIEVNSALPTIDGSVAIEGPGESSLTIETNPSYTGAIFSLFTLAANANASFSGMTLDATLNTDAITVGQGAGLVVSQTQVGPSFFAANINTLPAAILANQDAGAITIENSQFTGNSSVSVYDIGAASLTIANSSFTGNYNVNGPAGAVFVSSDANGNGGAFTISDSTFSGNTATNGGAIELSQGASGTIVDSTFTGNTAMGHGGGIALYPLGVGSGPTSLTLADSTIADNVTDLVGGGVYVGSTEHALLVDTIVAQNTESGGAMDDVYGPLNASSSFNLIGDGAGVTGVTAFTQGNLLGTAAAPINPMLGPLQNNGGPTLTMALLSGSPAIDSGGPSPTTDAQFPTDQRGLPRINDLSSVLNPYGGDGRDIGAVELQGTLTPTVLTVNTTADANPPAGTLSLREAIEAVDGTIALSSLPASQVQVNAPGVYAIDINVTGQIVLGSQLPALAGDVSLVGPTTGNLTIVGTGQTDEPVLSVASVARVTLDNLTIDGDNGGGADDVLLGAGSVLSATSDTFENIGLPPNDATFSGGILAIAGGTTVTVELSTFENLLDTGIFNEGGAVSIDESTFANNTDPQGFGGGVLDSPESGGFGGELTITRSLFENNFAGQGGAVAIFGGSAATITDSTFSHNTGESTGGAITLTQDSLAAQELPSRVAVLRSTIVDNSSPLGGGLRALPLDLVILQDSIIAGNTNGSSPDDVSATFSAASSNDLIGDGAGQTGLTNGTNGVHFGTAAAPLNPLLGPLQNNGGPTLTMAPLSGSPALDAGSGIVDTGTDQRGVVRGTVIDIGAYQATATQLDVTGFPSPSESGASHAFSVSAVDPFGQPALDFNSTVSFSSSDPSASLPTGQSLVGGQGSFNATLNTAGVQSITASAGGLSGSQTGITINAPPILVANLPPTLAAIGNQTVAAGQSLTLTLQGSDPNGLPLTYSASVDSLAYHLKSTLGLYEAGSFYTNYYGGGEQWVQGNGGTWYYILPNGGFYQWSGGGLTGTLIAQLGSAYNANPSLLVNAQPGQGQASVSVSGYTLTITPNTGFTGILYLTAMVSDGHLSASQTFTVTVTS